MTPTLTPLEYLYPVIAGLFATMGFAVWFSVPPRLLARVCLVGTLGFALRYGLVNWYQCTPFLGSYVAAFVVGTLGFLLARWIHVPRAVFTIPGVIPMIPGVAAHSALVAFSAGEVNAGLQDLVKAIMIVGALAAGLTTARGIISLIRQSKATYGHGQ